MSNPKRPFLSDIRRILQQLYQLNMNDLPQESKAQHRQALHEAYLALLRSENAAFEQTLIETNTSLKDLQTATAQLATDLEQAQNTRSKLQLAARGIEILRKVAL